MPDVIEGFRLSPQQSDRWMLQQQSQDQQLFCVQCVVQLEGQLVAGDFEAAVQRLVDRNEILRTVFYRHPGTRMPLQVVRESQTCVPSWVDLGQESKLEELAGQFDLEHGPLLQIHVFSLPGDKHTLTITLPSLCMDGWTMQNLVRELALSYEACRTGETLTGEPLRYVQFAQWQNELLEDDDDSDSAAGKEYWRRQLQSFPIVQLPLEKRAREERFSPATLVKRLPSEIVAGLELLSRAREVKTEDVLLGCWATLLHKLTGAGEVLVTVLADGRRFAELAEALGLLARSLPVRVEFADGVKIGEVVEAVSGARGEAERWQDYFSYERMGGEWCPFGFEWQEEPARVSGGGVSWEVVEQRNWLEPQKVKLVCVVERSGGWRLQWQYDERVLSAGEMERLARQYEVLLASVVSGKDATVEELEVMSAAERRAVVAEYNLTATEYEVGGKESLATLAGLFAAQAARTPGALALVYEDEQLTYAELNQRANQLGHYLRARGVGAETLVAVLLERSVELVVGLLAVLKAGAAYVPIDPEYPLERVQYMVADSGARVMLTQAGLAGNVDGCAIVELDREREQIACESDENVAVTIDPGNLAYVIYTSGSTGRPKGVAVEHRQIVNYIKAVTEEIDLASVKSFAMVSTFSADLGNTVLFPSLTGGGCLHLISAARASDPEGLSHYFLRHPVDCLKIVPSHLAALQGSNPKQVMPARKLILGGEASRWSWVKELLEAAPNCEIYNHYGPTETTVGVLAGRVCAEESHPNSLTIPLGRPLPNIRVYVLDRQMRAVPLGVTGELYIGGAGVTRGYLHHAALTADRFVPDPFGPTAGARLYRTGDIVRVLSDRKLEYLGRIDGQIKVRGYRIELGEIEAVLCKDANVKEAVVVAREFGRDQRLVAYVVGASTQPPNVNDLRSHAQAYLPQHMLPSWYVVLRQLPLTINGKIDKLALPDPELERPDLETPFEPPTTNFEKILAGIWSKVLGVERIGIRDSFFALGGDSILSVRVVALAKEQELRFTIQQLFQHQTIKELAHQLESVVQQTPSSTEVEDLDELSRLLDEVDQLSEAEVLLKLEEKMQLAEVKET